MHNAHTSSYVKKEKVLVIDDNIIITLTKQPLLKCEKNSLDSRLSYGHHRHNRYKLDSIVALPLAEAYSLKK